MAKRRTFLLAALTTAFCLVLLEGALSWTYAVKKTIERSQPRRAERGHAEYDPDLGWVNRTSVRIENLYGPGLHFTTNSQRFRANADFSIGVPPGRTRVFFVGDSFTMGHGVDDSQTFPAYVERMDPSIQSVNMGMGAYGLDQSYLWYLRDGLPFKTHIVVVAFIAGDFTRMTLDYYISPKPRLKVVNDELMVLNTPVPRTDAKVIVRKAAREFTYWLDIAKMIRLGVEFIAPSPTQEDAARHDITGGDFSFAPAAERIFENLNTICRTRGQQLLLIYLPTRADFDQPQPVAAWTRRVAGEKGIPFVNLTPEFERSPSPERWELFLSSGISGHYSPAGNRRIAAALLPVLNELASTGHQLGGS